MVPGQLHSKGILSPTLRLLDQRSSSAGSAVTKLNGLALPPTDNVG